LFCSVCRAEGLVGKAAEPIHVRQWITRNPPSAEDLSGRVYVLEFWATWCHACVGGVPDLIALNDKYKDKGLYLIALSADKSADDVTPFVREKNINYHVALDNGTANWFDVKGYPTLVVVDHKGMVVWQGYTWNGGFEKALKAALAAAPPPLLVDVELGPFEHLKKPLFGGDGFAEAYNQIKAGANGNGNSTKTRAAAKNIVGTIDKRIARQIERADLLCAADPVSAYYRYADIVSKYDGIEAVEPARAACLRLKNGKSLRDKLLIAEMGDKNISPAGR